MRFYPKISCSLHTLFHRIHLQPCIKFYNMLFLSDERLFIQCIHIHHTASNFIHLQQGIMLFSAVLSFMNDTTKIRPTLTTFILYFWVCSWTYFLAFCYRITGVFHRLKKFFYFSSHARLSDFFRNALANTVF